VSFQSILPSKTENKILDSQIQKMAVTMAHYSTCCIVLIYMQMGIAGCACTAMTAKKQQSTNSYKLQRKKQQ
jgi:hypothetical protein